MKPEYIYEINETGTQKINPYDTHTYLCLIYSLFFSTTYHTQNQHKTEMARIDAQSSGSGVVPI